MSCCKNIQKYGHLKEEESDDDHLYILPDSNSVTKNVLRRLFIASGIAFVFLIAEVVGGVLSGSLAILSDAAHMFSDVSGFFISIFSIWIGTKPASQSLSYGYHRAEVIGALASIILIWGLTIALLVEATDRIMNKSTVTEPLFMLVTAIFGLLCNLGMAKVLHSSPGHNPTHGNCGHDHGNGHSHSHKKKPKLLSEGKVESVPSDQGQHSEQQHEENGDHKCDHNHEGHDHHNHEGHEHEHNHDHKEGSNDHNHDHKEGSDDHNHDHNHEDHCHDHKEGDHEHNHNHDDLEKQSHFKEGIDKKDINLTIQKKNEQTEKSNGHSHDHNDHNHDHNDHHDHDHSKGKNISKISEKDNYNLRAAMIHVIGDIIQSIGVVIAALLIYLLADGDEYSYWQLADPVCTYLFSVLVLFTTARIAFDCAKVLMEGTPHNISTQELQNKMLEIKDVKEVHDIHIWSLSVGKPAMSAHLSVQGDKNDILRKATKVCRQYGIYHSTIQIEDWEIRDTRKSIKCNHNIHY